MWAQRTERRVALGKLQEVSELFAGELSCISFGLRTAEERAAGGINTVGRQRRASTLFKVEPPLQPKTRAQEAISSEWRCFGGKFDDHDRSATRWAVDLDSPGVRLDEPLRRGKT